MKKRSAFQLSYNIDVSPRSKGSARRLNILGPLRSANYCRRPFRSDLQGALTRAGLGAPRRQCTGMGRCADPRSHMCTIQLEDWQPSRAQNNNKDRQWEIE